MSKSTMVEGLVSIIVPTYNRAHLIGETLDSILAQSYLNWECIVVDDGSNDETDVLVLAYVHQDSRFRYFKRPDSHKAGGNGARNYGLKQSRGAYVQWFDSDDLMAPEKLALEVAAIEKFGVDFVVSKTRYFNHVNNSFFNYEFEEGDVTFESFAVDYIRWHTPDVLVRKSVLEGLHFNEEMSAGQEYNFYCKLLLQTTNLYYLKQFLTLRRFSENSIQGQRDVDPSLHQVKLFETHWYNYMDLKGKANSSKFNRYSLLQCVQSYFQARKHIELPENFRLELIKTFPSRYLWFYIGLFSQSISGRYYVFYRLLKNKEVFNTYHMRSQTKAF